MVSPCACTNPGAAEIFSIVYSTPNRRISTCTKGVGVAPYTTKIVAGSHGHRTDSAGTQTQIGFDLITSQASAPSALISMTSTSPSTLRRRWTTPSPQTASVQVLVHSSCVSSLPSSHSLHPANPSMQACSLHSTVQPSALSSLPSSQTSNSGSSCATSAAQHAVVADGHRAAVEAGVGVFVVAVVASFKIGVVVSEIGAQKCRRRNAALSNPRCSHRNRSGCRHRIPRRPRCRAVDRRGARHHRSAAAWQSARQRCRLGYRRHHKTPSLCRMPSPQPWMRQVEAQPSSSSLLASSQAS